MREICYDQSGVVGALAAYSNAISANTVGVQSASCVYAHVYLVVGSTEETLLLSGGLGDVVDEAIWTSMLICGL